MSTAFTGVKKKVADIIEPAIEAEGMELLALETLGQKSAMTLRIYLDKPDGVTIDDCAKMSRSISVLLDVEDVIKSKYFLEVSSPGFNRPLVKPEHFKRFVGERVKVKTTKPAIENRKNFLGTLLEYNEEKSSITIEYDSGSIDIALLDIEKANIDFPFDTAKNKKKK